MIDEATAAASTLFEEAARLRKEAEGALGRKFDIRAFHDQVLGSGALPMKVLEGKVRGWIARTRAAR